MVWEHVDQCLSKFLEAFGHMIQVYTTKTEKRFESLNAPKLTAGRNNKI